MHIPYSIQHLVLKVLDTRQTIRRELSDEIKSANTNISTCIHEQYVLNNYRIDTATNQNFGHINSMALT